MRNKRIITALAITLLLVTTFLAPRPVAGASSILVQRLWGGSYSDSAYAVAVDRAGNIYSAGTTYSYGPGSPSCNALSILKYSAQGNMMWQRLWWNGSSAQATGIAVDPSGNIYVTGTLYTTCNGYWDGFLLKLDSTGSLVWQKTITQSLDSQFNALAVDGSGNVFVAGYYYTGPAGFSDMLLMRFNATGGLVWQKAWGGSQADSASGIVLDSSDNIYVVGQTSSFGFSGPRLALLKLDSSGNILFEKMVGTGYEAGTAVGLDSTGNIYAVGTANSGSSSNILLVKFDPTGGPLWQKTWGGNRTNIPTGLAVDSSGNVEIAGYTNNYGAGGNCGPYVCRDILMMKLDGSGNVLSELVYGSPGVNDQATGVADSFGTMVAVGFVNVAPPYQIGSGNNTLGTGSFYVTSQGNNTMGLPTYPVTNINGGGMINASGSQTYSGLGDQIMLRFGDQPKLTFATSPGTGTITFNGTAYSNGQSTNLSIGNATATATAPSGYMFTGWNATGGVSVSSSTASTVQVTVAGSGTLTAKFQQTSSPASADYSLYYILGGVAAATAAALIGVNLFRRGKRSSSPTQTAASKT